MGTPVPNEPKSIFIPSFENHDKIYACFIPELAGTMPKFHYIIIRESNVKSVVKIN